MVEYSVTYARKQNGTWKKGSTKVSLWFQATGDYGDLVVHTKERCLEKLRLYKWSPVTISRIDHQIRFMYTEKTETRQFAVEFDSIQAASQFKTILDQYSTCALDESQRIINPHSQESRRDDSQLNFQNTALHAVPTNVPVAIQMDPKEEKQRKRQELVHAIKVLLADTTFKDLLKAVEEIVESDPDISIADWW